MISGEKFQLLSEVSFHGELTDNIIIEQNNNISQNLLKINDTDISEIKKYNRIFIYTHFVEDFFNKFFDHLNDNTIIITHNSDAGINNKHIKYLDSKKIKAWYCQNKLIDHPKLVSIPIGMANSQWQHGNQDIIKQIREENNLKNNLVFKNFDIGTNSAERKICNDITEGNLIRMQPTTSNIEYWRNISKSAFAISPPGNGIDCHRIWECLYLRTIPIIKDNKAFNQFRHLPILFINDWNKITISFLRERVPDNLHKLNKKFQKDFNNIKELDINYWKAVMLS